ncbi:hypothetical protein [Persicitalea sp.]|uniref:hypothetical protein n=1 Tax=Persicitalea sp. TaxID=3100273 RepID=UPI0035933AB1
MKAVLSKAQIEVWERKGTSCEAVKHLSIGDAMRFIHERTEDTIAQIERNRAMEKAVEAQALFRELE